MGRSRRHHRLAGGRHPADAPQLERRCCRCPATAATSGTATCRSRRCRREVNPARGFIATANNYLLPERLPLQGPAALHVGRSVPRLAHRRGARLGPAASASAEMTRLQNDDLSIVGARAGAAAARRAARQSGQRHGARPADARGTSCSTRTRSPPASTRCGSGACSPTRARWSCPPPRARPCGANLVSTKRVIDWLHAPDGRFGADPDRRRATRWSPAAWTRRWPS